MASILEVLADIKAHQRSGIPLVKDWRKDIPSWSKWFPGSKGDPNCRECEGMGYVRLDLPLGHKYFGKVFTCECVARMMQTPAGRWQDNDDN